MASDSDSRTHGHAHVELGRIVYIAHVVNIQTCRVVEGSGAPLTDVCETIRHPRGPVGEGKAVARFVGIERDQTSIISTGAVGVHSLNDIHSGSSNCDYDF